jgi:hypothetical protein
VPDEDVETGDTTITVPRPTLDQAVTTLLAPPAHQRVAGAPPPIVQPDPGPQTRAARRQVQAVALVTGWTVLLPNGVRVDALRPLLLGRRPTLGAGPVDSLLVTVPDSEGTVSRDHLLIEPLGGTLRLTNMSRKNTIPVAWPDGVRYSIVPGEQLVVASICAAKLGRVPVLLQRA